ncbi:uncharacterized protein LOC120582338 [Pteropus medius]|uniref:uncharacterized protein LOC120582338 n=1 Tax=Pteropus vampyrus TaxID=132908 RepID=UPI00196A6DBF|nr:uncharacterized protein LOC120582338 [Pteropus giganteus]
MEHLLSETGQPTKTDMWELKLKGLVDRVQMLHPQLLRLLVQAGVLQLIQATASSTEIQAQEMWHRARGPWGVTTMAPVQATVHIIQRFLLGACLLVICSQLRAGADEDADARGRELPRAGVLRQAQQTREGPGPSTGCSGGAGGGGNSCKDCRARAAGGKTDTGRPGGHCAGGDTPPYPLAHLHPLFSGCHGLILTPRSLTHYDTMMLLNN